MREDTRTIEAQPRANQRPTAGGAPSFASVYFLLVLLLAAGVYFRFAHLDRKVYWNDEVITSMWFSGLTVDEVRDGLVNREVGVSDVLRCQRFDADRGMGHFLTALARDDAHHPPGFYGLERLWAGQVGDSVATARSLPALLSLLAFPCLYWLCRELFSDRLTAWVAVGLLAVSPFHVLYAQEAREYSLLTVFVLLSSAALLRALRVQTRFAWAFYGLSVALGLYTSFLFGTVAVAHGVYVAWTGVTAGSWRGFLRVPSVRRYLTATVVGGAAFVPWAVVLLTHMTRVRESLSWMADEKSFASLVDGWCLGISSVVFDPVPDRENKLAFFVRLPGVFLVVASVAMLCYRTPVRTWLLPLSLMVVTGLTVAVPDLVAGGRRSCMPRYALAGYAAVLIAVAQMVAAGLASTRARARTGWLVVLLALVGSGAASDALSSRAVRWWNKGWNNHTPLAAEVVNSSARPLVVSEFGDEHFGNVISLAHRLHPQARFWLMRDSAPSIGDGFSDIFLFKPSGALIRRFEATGYRVELTSAPGVCRLRRPAEPTARSEPHMEPGSLSTKRAD